MGTKSSWRNPLSALARWLRPSVEVHIYNAPPGAHAVETTNGPGSRRVDVILKQAVGDAIGSSSGAAEMRKVYGLGPRSDGEQGGDRSIPVGARRTVER